MRVTNTVSSLEVGSWRPSLGLALKVPFPRTSTLLWDNQNLLKASKQFVFSGRPAASRDRWVQGSCDHSGLSRVRPVDEVCQVLALLIVLSTTSIHTAAVHDWNINCRPNLDKLFYSWSWCGWKCFVCKSTEWILHQEQQGWCDWIFWTHLWTTQGGALFNLIVNY